MPETGECQFSTGVSCKRASAPPPGATSKGWSSSAAFGRRMAAMCDSSDALFPGQPQELDLLCYSDNEPDEQCPEAEWDPLELLLDDECDAPGPDVCERREPQSELVRLLTTSGAGLRPVRIFNACKHIAFSTAGRG